MKPKYIFISLILIALVTFLLRLITMSSPIPTDDPLYNLRQIDSLIANNLNYTWFDPLNMYQSDATVFWSRYNSCGLDRSTHSRSINYYPIFLPREIFRRLENRIDRFGLHRSDWWSILLSIYVRICRSPHR